MTDGFNKVEIGIVDIPENLKEIKNAKDFCNYAFSQSTQYLIQAGEHSPTVLFLSEDKFYVLITSFDDENFTHTIKHVVKEYNIKAVCLISEAWVLMGIKENATRNIIRPSENPDRKEAIFCRVEWKNSDNPYASRIAQIIRDEDDKISKLIEIDEYNESMSSCDAEGRLVGFFDED